MIRGRKYDYSKTVYMVKGCGRIVLRDDVTDTTIDWVVEDKVEG